MALAGHWAVGCLCPITNLHLGIACCRCQWLTLPQNPLCTRCCRPSASMRVHYNRALAVCGGRKKGWVRAAYIHLVDMALAAGNGAK